MKKHIKKRLDFFLVKHIFEKAFLPFRCSVTYTYIKRRKIVLYHVFDEYEHERLWGEPLFTDFCSTKFGNGFPSILLQGRDLLVEGGVDLHPWKSPFEESMDSKTGLLYAVLTNVDSNAFQNEICSSCIDDDDSIPF